MFRKLFAFIFIGLLSNNLYAASLEEIKARGYLKVGVYAHTVPFGYLDQNGERAGFDIELARELARDLFGDAGKVEFTSVNGNDRIPALLDDRVDVILANFSKTARRSKTVDFAAPYSKTHLAGISHKNNPIVDLKQLEGKTALVTAGTTSENFFKGHQEVVLKSYKKNDEVFQALEKGEGLVMVHDNTILVNWLNQHPDYELFLDHLGGTTYIAPAVKKGNEELLEWLNREIGRMKKDGRLHQIYEKVMLPVYGNRIREQDLIAE